MLFTCDVCNLGHPSLNVEGFIYYTPGGGRRHVYLCKEHIDQRKDFWRHTPWLSDSSDYCSVCDTVGPSARCYGKKTQPGLIIRGTGKNFCISRDSF